VAAASLPRSLFPQSYERKSNNLAEATLAAPSPALEMCRGIHSAAMVIVWSRAKE